MENKWEGYGFFFLVAVGEKEEGCPRGRKWMEILTVDGCDKKKEERGRERDINKRRETNK